MDNFNGFDQDNEKPDGSSKYYHALFENILDKKLMNYRFWIRKSTRIDKY